MTIFPCFDIFVILIKCRKYILNIFIYIFYSKRDNKQFNALVRKSKLNQVEGVEKGKGRLKITLVEVVKKNVLVWQTWLGYLEYGAGLFDVSWLVWN